MAEGKHPYTSGIGGLVKAVNHLRKSFPAEVNAKTLQKLGIAPNNESYVINILRFIHVIDGAGKRTPEAAKVFTKHSDDEFASGFASLVQGAYDDLFQVHGESTWELPSTELITYFRSTDQTTALVGQRQANTFQALAGLSGYSKATAKPAPTKTPAKKSSVKANSEPRSVQKAEESKTKSIRSDLGLTVRIEINLPPSGDQETYDKIFESIRKNFVDG